MLTAFLLGLTGSLHCAGMCAPLAALVAARHPGSTTLWVYNGGRILVYGLLGAWVAVVGGWLQLPRYQMQISVIVGVLLILVALGWRWQPPLLAVFLHWWHRGWKRIFARGLAARGHMGHFFLGIINGLLPCGVSYAALLYASAANQAAVGFLWMALFGVGTGPAMYLVAWALSRTGRTTGRLPHWMPLAMALGGFWLVFRAWRFAQPADWLYLPPPLCM